jgi:prepilin-type N-terminal cleavage/methylation domain-containing protein
MKKLFKGFTLIELLVVIGILAILLAITLIAINPARQFGQANNTRRRSETLQILNAIHQYVAENNGQLPVSVSGLDATTATDFSGAAMPTLCADLMPNYIPALPVDPSLNLPNITDCAVTTWDTGYQIMRDEANRVTVSAPVTDNNVTIAVTR